jgi:hypothetical protein
MGRLLEGSAGPGCVAATVRAAVAATEAGASDFVTFFNFAPALFVSAAFASVFAKICLAPAQISRLARFKCFLTAKNSLLSDQLIFRCEGKE